METVFETGIPAGNWWSLIPVAVGVIGAAVILTLRKKGRRVDGKVKAFIAVFAAVGAVLLARDAMTCRDIVGPYRRGEALTVEGPVEEFIPTVFRRNPYESFTVDGVRFVLGGEAEGHFGYGRTSAFGGAVDRDGMYVKIYYIPYNGTNVIVRLDMEA